MKTEIVVSHVSFYLLGTIHKENQPKHVVTLPSVARQRHKQKTVGIQVSRKIK